MRLVMIRFLGVRILWLETVGLMVEGSRCGVEAPDREQDPIFSTRLNPKSTPTSLNLITGLSPTP